MNSIISELVQNRLLCLFQKVLSQLETTKGLSTVFFYPLMQTEGMFPTFTFFFVKELIPVAFFLVFFFFLPKSTADNKCRIYNLIFETK